MRSRAVAVGIGVVGYVGLLAYERVVCLREVRRERERVLWLVRPR
jgi:hypothetical protein